MHQIEVFSKDRTARDRTVTETLSDMGISAQAEVSDVYYLDGALKDADVNEAAEFFTDKVTQRHETGSSKKEGSWIIEVRYKDGVSDPAGDVIMQALTELGKKVSAVRTANRYYVKGEIQESDVQKICRKELANEIVQDYYYDYENLPAPKPGKITEDPGSEIRRVEILEAGDSELKEISAKGLLSLSPEEMKKIKEYFESEGRNPTDGEMETIAQTWSEHCKHKTFNGRIKFTDQDGKKEIIKNLFEETIVAATKKISESKDWIVSAFKDNAGIIKLDEKNNLAFKVETHNHPSALDPYGGASTGVGGVIRDILGAGLGAKPIFNTDAFCLARPDYDKELPSGMLHPKRTFRGVVSGVRDYGNRMGIPTVNGAIAYHDDFRGAPLVFCGTGGLLPKGMESKKAGRGERIVVVGGKTGRDGLHGATFSSAVLDENAPGSAVQIGNPIEEKKMADALLKARDRGLYTCITDCGAGGLSSAVGEMAQSTGAEVDLEGVELKHAGMQPWEIWTSESQERMVLSVPEDRLKELKEVFSREGVTVCVIGKITDSKRLVVRHELKSLVDLDMEFLHHGLPKPLKEASWNENSFEEPEPEEKENYDEDLKKLLAHPTIASKEEVVRRYDYEVQGNTIGKPLVGAFNDGPSDAAVIRPEFGSTAIVIANGINPRYGMINSYHMAASAIDEALRNVVASGGDLNRTALLDNFCWADTSRKEKLGSLVMAAKACRDVAVAYGTPFISGKDSLNNEFSEGGKRIGIPDTLLISAVSVTDTAKIVSMDLKEEGNEVYVVGRTYDELGGSCYYDLSGKTGANVPMWRPESKRDMERLSEAMRAGLVRSCHDCSEGGIAVAAAEMAFAGNVGLKMELDDVTRDTDNELKILFSESNGRFLVEVRKENGDKFRKLTGAAKIGETAGGKKLTITKHGKSLIDSKLDDLKAAWKGTIKW